MHKIFQLAHIVRRCNTEQTLNNKGSYFSPLKIILSVIGCVLMGLLGYSLGRLEPILGDSVNVLQTMFLAAAAISFMMSFVGIINFMYMSDDLGTLLTLPYTPSEIIIAKVMVASSTAILLSFIVIVPAGVMYGVTCSAAFNYYLAIALAFICIPSFVICLIGIVLVIVMHFSRGLHNRNTVKVITAVLTFILLMAAFVLTYGPNTITGDQAARIFEKTAGLTKIIPFMPALNTLMRRFTIWGIICPVIMTAAAVALFILLVSKLYLDSALAMQESGSAGISSKNDLYRPKSAYKAFLRKEFLHVKRNPAFLVNGFLYPIIFPAIVIFLYVFSSNAMKAFSLSNITSPELGIMWSLCITCVITYCASGANSIACSAYSRDGADYMVIKQAPAYEKDVLKAKQRLSIYICAFGSTSYVLIGGFVLFFMKKIPLAAIPLSLILNVCILFLSVNTSVMHNIKHPVFDWENEAVMLKNCTGFVSFISVFGGILVSIILMAVASFFKELTKYIIPGMLIVFLLLALLSNLRLYKKGIARIKRF